MPRVDAMTRLASEILDGLDIDTPAYRAPDASVALPKPVVLSAITRRLLAEQAVEEALQRAKNS